MAVIICDHNRIEQGVLSDYSINYDTTETMDFEMKLPLRKDENIDIGEFYWYIPDTEYGGISDGIGVETSTGELSYKGRNWRGILASKIIEPDSGQDYKTVSGNLADITNALLRDAGLSDLFSAGKSNKYVSSFRFARYMDLYSGLVKLGNACGQVVVLKSATEKKDKQCQIGTVQVMFNDSMDYSSDVEYNNYNINFKINKGIHAVNHLICLGQGELKDRMVLHLYVNADGDIVNNQYYYGLDEWTEIYENTSAATESELRQGGIERLKELMSSDSVDVTAPDISLKVGDVIGGREEITGITVKREIVNIIADIDDDGIAFTYKVGEKISPSKNTRSSGVTDQQNITVDSALSDTSKNPVENRVVTNELNNHINAINNINEHNNLQDQVIVLQGNLIEKIIEHNGEQDNTINDLQQAITGKANVYYGIVEPPVDLGEDKDFYLRINELTDDILDPSKFDVVEEPSYPIALSSFTKNSRNDFDFVITGIPSNHDAGEHSWFTLDGLVEGHTYHLSFTMKFNDGASWTAHGNDYFEICGERITFTEDSQPHSYSIDFTYIADGKAEFMFYGLTDRVEYMVIFSNFSIDGDFADDNISELYNKYEGKWRLYKGGAGYMSELTDVELTNLADGEILKYNATLQKWENAIESGQSALILNAQKYSTEEQVVGVWTDGKPLYQKTIITFNTTENAEVNIDISSLDIDTMVNMEGLFSRIVNGLCLYYPFTAQESNVNNFNLTNGGYFRFFKTNNSITYVIYASDNSVTDHQQITIQYTKTTDTAGSGGYQAYGFSPIIYSEEEREIGIWTDGKPLYQKTYSGTLPNTEPTSNYFAISLSDIDSVAIVGGVLNDITPINSYYSDSNYNIFFINSAKTNIVVNGRNISGNDFKVTIQYTKITDAAGSGEYTTLGIPSVHYSTDEQVIGTWIDGKPLYQKTFTIASGSLSSTVLSLNSFIDLTNINELIDTRCVFHDDTTNRNHVLPYTRVTDSESIYAQIEVLSDNTISFILFTRGSRDYSSLSNIRLTLQYTKTTD